MAKGGSEVSGQPFGHRGSGRGPERGQAAAVRVADDAVADLLSARRPGEKGRR